MKRLLAIALGVTLLLTPPATAQQGGLDDFGVWLSVLTGNVTREARSIVAVTADGERMPLAEGHDPISDATWVFDFSGFDAPLPDPPGDAGAGTAEYLDLIQGFGARLLLTDAARDRLAAAIPDAGAAEAGGIGFARPFSGEMPAFPNDSAVIGFQSASWITGEDDPLDFKITTRFQISVAGLRGGSAPATTDDSNGGNSFSIDMYQSNGGFGTGSYDFPSGNFTERTTAWSGAFLGDRGVLIGPASELEDIEDIKINLVEFPDFDALPLGSLDSFPVVSVSTFAEGDLNGDGVWDVFEVAEEPVEDPPPVEEAPVDPPAVVDEPDQAADPPAEETADGAAGEDATEGAGVADADGDSRTLIAIIAIVGGLGVVGAGLWLWLKQREQEKCVPEAEALAAAKAEVAAAEAAVTNAKKKVADAEAGVTRAAGAREQAALRQQEAAIALREANSELALAEGRREDAQSREAAAQHAYDVCMGFVAPDPRPAPEVSTPAPPPQPEAPEPPPVEVPAGGPPGVVAGPAGTTPPPAPGGSSAPPSEKEETCNEGDERILEELGELKGRFVLAYTITAGTEGIRATEQEVTDVVRSLDGIADAVSDATSGLSSAGSGAGALVARAAGTVLELTARLGAGTAALTNELLEGHRVHTFTYEEIALTVDLRWVKLERCVGGEWQCFYDLKVTTWRPSNVTTAEKAFEGRPDLRDREIRRYQRKGDDAVKAANAFDLFMDAAYVGPC